MTNCEKLTFKTGQVFLTSAVAHEVAESETFAKEEGRSLERHVSADFSDMESQDDIAMNIEAIKTGEDRIFSGYNTSKGKIWIITEQDRSATTVMFPEDY